MEGTLYSVGIGPGDPELMTLKAVRLIVEADVIAIPQGDNDVLTAKNIVNQVVDLSAKEQLLIYMPMTKDMAAMRILIILPLWVLRVMLIFAVTSLFLRV